MDKSVLYNVQKQKIKETQVHLVEWMSIKQSFLKQHIPIQQRLIKNLDNASQITMLRLRQAVAMLTEQRQLQQVLIERFQKSLLNDEKRFTDNITAHSSVKPPSKKQIEAQGKNIEAQIVWSSNVDKVFNCLANSHKKRIIDSQAFIKVIQNCESELSKEMARYYGEVKKCVKGLQKWIEKIDLCEKEQDQAVQNIRKESKNKDRDGGFYLAEYKKLQMQIGIEFGAFSQRGKEIFQLMKTILDNEKSTSKKFREVLDGYFKTKNSLYKQNQFDERFLGALVVMQENVVQSRKLYFNKFLLGQDHIEIIKTLVPQPNMNGPVPNLECIVRYLKLETDDFLTKLNAKTKLEFLATNLCYKRWQKVSLAKGWLITSYVPVTIYLTYDNNLIIISVKQNELVRKVNLKLAKINRVQNGNVVFLEETIKGFFSDSQEEYQIKFDNFDNLEEFMVFIENKSG